MKKAFATACVLLVAVFAVAYFYFSNLTHGSKQTGKVLSFIPSNSLFVASFKNDEAFYEIFKNYKPFKAIAGQAYTNEILSLRNSLFTQPGIFRIFNGKQVYASLHPNQSSPAFLWLTTLNETFDKEEVLKLISSAGSISPIGEYYTLSLKGLNKKFYFFVEAGFAIGSFSEQILQAALNKNSSKISQSFIDEISNQSQKPSNSPLDLFVDHTSLKATASVIFNDQGLSGIRFLKSLSGTSSLNMNFKSDVLMLNGLSLIDTTLNNYPSIFLHQKPENNTLKKIFTKNTASFLTFSISDFNLFSNDLRLLFASRKQLKSLENQLQNISAKTGVDAEKDLRKFLAKEFALVQLSNLERIAVLKLTNGSEFAFNLENLSSPYSEYIRRMNHSNLFYYFYGDPLKEFTRPFFTVIDNYLIASNSARAVNQFYNDYIDGEFLVTDSSFVDFNQYLANQSNIFYFVHIKNSGLLRRKALRKNFIPHQKNSDNLRSFYGFSLQLSGDKDHFFTNFFADYIGE